MLEDFRRSGLSRRQYCERVGIPTSTLDYYKRRAKVADGGARLVRVELEAVTGQECADKAHGFALVLANGRRIEGGWDFGEADLIRLIRAAEAQ